MMRRSVPLLVGVLAILLFGEAVYVMTSRPEIKVTIQAASQVQPANAAMNKRITKQREIPEATADLEAIPSPSLKIFVPPLNLPASPDNIKAGMVRDQLQSVFGEPCLKIATSDQRQLVETYVFPEQYGDKVTVAQLRNGVVTSAYAKMH